jgi:hypothetical protein
MIISSEIKTIFMEQKTMPKKTQTTLQEKEKASDARQSGSIVPTSSWINVKGKAVYVNIPEADIRLTTGKDGSKRISFITSMVSLENLVSGKNLGVNLGRFQD